MNLGNLFSAQKKLRERINYNGEDRFEKLILSLLVEIGECANEWRGFKFWSKDQEPRTKVVRQGKTHSGLPARHLETYNPLLEEYVDGLHFVLEIGIEKGWETNLIHDKPEILKNQDTTIQFIQVKKDALDTWSTKSVVYYKFLFGSYIGLGQSLGFTWEQIEQAYFDKNQINHERQNNGY